MNPKLGVLAVGVVVMFLSGAGGPYGVDLPAVGGAGATTDTLTPTSEYTVMEVGPGTVTTVGGPTTAPDRPTQRATYPSPYFSETATQTRTATVGDSTATQTPPLRTATRSPTSDTVSPPTTDGRTFGARHSVMASSCREVRIIPNGEMGDVEITVFNPDSGYDMIYRQGPHTEAVEYQAEGPWMVTGASVYAGDKAHSEQLTRVEFPCPRPTEFLGSTHTPFCYTTGAETVCN